MQNLTASAAGLAHERVPYSTEIEVLSEETWLADPVVRYEKLGLRTKRAAAAVLREVYNREGVLHLVRSHWVLDAEPDPEAIWDAVLRFLAEQPGIPSIVLEVHDGWIDPNDKTENPQYVDVPKPSWVGRHLDIDTKTERPVFDERTRPAKFKGRTNSTAAQFWQQRSRQRALKKAHEDRETHLSLPPGTMAQLLAQQTAEALLTVVWQAQGRGKERFAFNLYIEDEFALNHVGIDFFQRKLELRSVRVGRLWNVAVVVGQQWGADGLTLPRMRVVARIADLARPLALKTFAEGKDFAERSRFEVADLEATLDRLTSKSGSTQPSFRTVVDAFGERPPPEDAQAFRAELIRLVEYVDGSAGHEVEQQYEVVQQNELEQQHGVEHQIDLDKIEQKEIDKDTASIPEEIQQDAFSMVGLYRDGSYAVAKRGFDIKVLTSGDIDVRHLPRSSGLAGQVLLGRLREWELAVAEVDAPVLRGPDPFGLRRPLEKPDFLADIEPAALSAAQLPLFFSAVSMTNPRPGRLHPSMFVVDPSLPQPYVTTVQRDGGEQPWLPGRPERLPGTLSMAHLAHSIWLGDPLVEDGGTMSTFRENLAETARQYSGRAHVVLWTNQPRHLFDAVRGRLRDEVEPHLVPILEQLEWAQEHGILLINVDELLADMPGGLRELFAREMAKRWPTGYAAASDLLRMVILFLFGGLYADGDNEVGVSFLDDVLRVLSSPPAIALYTAIGVGNSHLMSPAGHPFWPLAFARAHRRYAIPQATLMADVGSLPGLARRNSLVRRTAPIISDVEEELGIDDEDILPELRGVGLNVTLSHVAPKQQRDRPPPLVDELTVAANAVTTLRYELELNRPGDLDLSAVNWAVSREPRPAVIWTAVISMIVEDPGLAPLIQTMTTTNAEVDLPPAVLSCSTSASRRSVTGCGPAPPACARLAARPPRGGRSSGLTTS